MNVVVIMGQPSSSKDHLEAYGASASSCNAESRVAEHTGIQRTDPYDSKCQVTWAFAKVVNRAVEDADQSQPHLTPPGLSSSRPGYGSSAPRAQTLFVLCGAAYPCGTSPHWSMKACKPP